MKEKAVGCANAGIHFVRLTVQEILILFKLGIVSKLVLQQTGRSAFLPFSELDRQGQSWTFLAFFCCPGVMYSYQVLIYDVLYYIASLQKQRQTQDSNNWARKPRYLNIQNDETFVLLVRHEALPAKKLKGRKKRQNLQKCDLIGQRPFIAIFHNIGVRDRRRMLWARETRRNKVVHLLKPPPSREHRAILQLSRW